MHDPDLVLPPACSPQLIGALDRKYNGAQVVVVELDDWELDIESSGPVKRILRSGAAAYMLAESVDELAAKISDRPHASGREPDPATVHELTSSSTVDDLIAAFLRESVDTRPATDTGTPHNTAARSGRGVGAGPQRTRHVYASLALR